MMQRQRVAEGGVVRSRCWAAQRARHLPMRPHPPPPACLRRSMAGATASTASRAPSWGCTGASQGRLEPRQEEVALSDGVGSHLPACASQTLAVCPLCPPAPPRSVEKEGFLTHCSCLARNTECDERCACAADPGCLNRSVTRRETVQLGRDAEEVDSWGMDCYVRRNILDGAPRGTGGRGGRGKWLSGRVLSAGQRRSSTPTPDCRSLAAVLESKAFGPWSPPDYQALQAADAAEYAAMRAATSAPGGSGASPAAAALAPPPLAAAHKVAAAAGQQQGDGPPSTPAGIKKEEGSAEHAAAVAVALASPPPTPAQIAVERRAADWMERELLPAINRQVGWRGRKTHQCAEAVPAQPGHLANAPLSFTPAGRHRLGPAGRAAGCQGAGEAGRGDGEPEGGRGGGAACQGGERGVGRPGVAVHGRLPAGGVAASAPLPPVPSPATTTTHPYHSGRLQLLPAAPQGRWPGVQTGRRPAPLDLCGRVSRGDPHALALVRDPGAAASRGAGRGLGGERGCAGTSAQQVSQPCMFPPCCPSPPPHACPAYTLHYTTQDAVKRITGDELPDFYNIVLERPKDDPGGYDVLFVDAAAKVVGLGGCLCVRACLGVPRGQQGLDPCTCVCAKPPGEPLVQQQQARPGQPPYPSRCCCCRARWPAA